jgi:hypothetical protein
MRPRGDQRQDSVLGVVFVVDRLKVRHAQDCNLSAKPITGSTRCRRTVRSSAVIA